MIEVRIRSFNQGGYETSVVRVDADKVVIRTRDEKANTLENDTLVLLREGVEVAWFASWDYATIDSALESVNE